ncbi:MAG: hypothetical protein AB2A00_02530 [Myxococcota bacterium]
MKRSPAALLCLLACAPTPSQTQPPVAIAGTQVLMDLSADWRTPVGFYAFPYPSDLRRLPGGQPDLVGFPNDGANAVVNGLREAAMERTGFPMIAVGYFAFDAAISAQDPEVVVPAATSSPVLLLDVDPASPERGRLFPTVAGTPNPDDYVAANLLTVAARPGFVLAPQRTYAFVIMRSLRDASGQPLGAPLTLQQLKSQVAPSGERGDSALTLYTPLWETLRQVGVNVAEVAAATVFTTGDVVKDLHELTEALKARHPVQITDLHLDPDDGTLDPYYCELRGTVRQPQFQRGVAPYDTEGLFEVGADGLPVEQEQRDIPVDITVPKRRMPAGGFPLVVYFHGSGGLSGDNCDDGPTLTVGGTAEKRLGPAHTVGALGLATAGAALPVNPERLPGAEDTAYLNLSNPPAFRDVFRQGVVEQRLYIEALRTLRIPPEVLAGCGGPELPEGEPAFHFDEDKLVAMGQSMGGAYTNLLGAVEPRVRIAVPTGAGGFWAYFILKTSLIDGAAGKIGLLLGTLEPLTFMHPAMNLLTTAWEPVEPLVFMGRLGRHPLPGHPVRPVYEPVGRNDRYFPTVLYDAMALAYGHQQAGQEVWSSMQEALALADNQGILPYPVQQNRTSVAGQAYTGVVVQYEGDGIADPHSIYRQLDAVKYQVGCFLTSFLATGVAVVTAPAPLGTPCP